MPAPPDRVRMDFPTRVMRLAVDPANPEHIYATLEVAGVVRSLDGGETWEDCSQPLIDLAQQPHLKSKIGSDTEIEGMMDGHALCVSSAAPNTVSSPCAWACSVATTTLKRGVTCRSAASRP
jgi:hypothetical protein